MVARSPRIPPPTTSEAARWAIQLASRRTRDGRRETWRAPESGLATGFHEVRRDLLVHPRDDSRHRLHALREDRDHEVGAVRQRDAADEMVKVVCVARL